MSDDWKPGDLALCVRSGGMTNPTRSGKVYEVESFWPHPSGGFALDFVGIYGGEPWGHPGWYGHDPRRFIKITPDEADEFDRETIALLNGERVTQ